MRPLQHLHIFLIDDNVEYAQSLGVALSLVDDKVKLSYVSNGKQALTKLRQGFECDVILLDLVMPVGIFPSSDQPDLPAGFMFMNELLKDLSVIHPWVILLSDHVDMDVEGADMRLVIGSIPRMTIAKEMIKQIMFFLSQQVTPREW